MEVCLTEKRQIPCCRLRGEIDRAHADYLFHGLSTAFILRPRGGIVVDFSEVTYIDSSGFSALIKILRTASEGSWIAAFIPPGHIRRLVEMVGLHLKPNFRLFDDVDVALATVRRAGPGPLPEGPPGHEG